MDSLAASGTRFQRQIRTERARPVNRSRSSTFTSGVAPPHLPHMHRSHSRNLSSSSITSMSSVSTIGGDDYRRAPLGFETPRTNRLSLDTYVPTSSPAAAAAHMQPYYGVGGNSPTGYSTPTSTSFSHGNSSPRFSSGLHSPINSSSRSAYWGASKTPHRRLSIGGSTPFQSSHSPDTQSSAHMSPAPSNAAIQRHSHYAASPGPSTLDSPRESPGTPVESDYRRHTWGPQVNTQLRRPRAEPSILTTNHITDLPRPRPVFPSMEQSSQVTRLPGIHTFDQPPPPSALLSARAPSPMHLDLPPTSHPVEQPQKTPVAAHPNRVSWTSGLQRDLNRLEITNDSRPTSWAPSNQTTVVPESPVLPSPIRGHSRHVSESSITSVPQPMQTTPTARKNKRMGWYIQPPSHQQVPNAERPSPDSSDGAPTPVTTSAGFQPAIVQGNGHVEPQGLGLSHVEEPPKTTFVQGPGHFQPPLRVENRISLPPRPQENLPNPFGLQKLHEHAPAEHFHHPTQQQNVHQPTHQPAAQQHMRQPAAQQHIHQPGSHVHHHLGHHVHQSPPVEHYNQPGQTQNDTRRLDALVAVATSEEQRI